MKGLDGLRIVQVECGGMHTVALAEDGKVIARSFITVLTVFNFWWIFFVAKVYGASLWRSEVIKKRRLKFTGNSHRTAPHYVCTMFSFGNHHINLKLFYCFIVATAHLFEELTDFFFVSFAVKQTVMCCSFLTQVYTWGCNDEGALGRVTSSTDGDEFTAGLVKDMEGVNVVMVSAGDSHTMGLSDKGTVFGWGTYRVIQFYSLVNAMHACHFSSSLQIQLPIFAPDCSMTDCYFQDWL